MCNPLGPICYPISRLVGTREIAGNSTGDYLSLALDKETGTEGLQERKRDYPGKKSITRVVNNTSNPEYFTGNRAYL
jgi:hypothetical protein